MIRCWQCGAAPTSLAEVTTIGDPEPVYLPAGWPPGDHEHAEQPPTPEQITDAAHDAGRRILAQWMA